MAKQPLKRTKHIPQRTCIGCQTVLPKKALIRIVRSEEGVKVDLTGKAPGRGAYIHGVRSCWEKALKGPVAHALKIELSKDDRFALEAFSKTLPDNDEAVSLLGTQPVADEKRH
ncbi:MAG: YlxR family protein [Anaerolineaceae bacterium]